MIFASYMRHKAVMALCLFIILIGSPLLVGQTKNETIEALINLVVENDSIPELEIPADLQQIVEEFYAEETVSDQTAAAVLQYMEGIYSEHDYYERGSWVKGDRNTSLWYVPYSGNLPEYENSDFKMPVEGSFTSRYGYRPRFRRFHKGIDISLNYGDTVKSALPGIVTKKGYEPGGYGHYVVVVHAGGVETLYGHLMFTLVSPGDKAEAGTPLGIGGSTGNSTGPHLHFETRYRGVPLDPVSWFKIKL